jgi:cob(I)alamin adenosyltransferase
MIYNFFGETKGKTSAALGTILRALGHGETVRVVFFMKNWITSETKFLDKLNAVASTHFDIEYYKSGDSDFIFVDEKTNHTTMEAAKKQLKFGNIAEKNIEDIKKAQMGYMKAISYLEAKPFLLVLDEINMAHKFGLISEEQVRNLIDTAKVNEVHLVLTGRSPSEKILALCDLATEMTKFKHPFDEGVYAVQGLDF